jgi:hypothetical protein
MAASPESFAQVGEWLKPTDCKSVPPSEVRRFESFPVHHVEPISGREPAGEIPSVLCEGTRVSRLSIALVCYVVLGVLTWITITDPKFRAGTLVVLVLFAAKSVLRRDEVLHPDKDVE